MCHDSDGCRQVSGDVQVIDRGYMAAALSCLKWAGAAALFLSIAAFDTRGAFRTSGLFGINSGAGGAAWEDIFGACTSGVDCICDVLAASDSQIFWHECYDHAAMIEPTSTDGGTYGNGNPVADVGSSGDRGGGSHWVTKYNVGNGDGQ